VIVLAKTSNRLQMTPLMALSILAIFAMMVPLFSLANNNRQQKVNTSMAAEKQMVVVTPSPSPFPY